MKKVLTVLMTFVLIFSLSFSTVAASKNLSKSSSKSLKTQKASTSNPHNSITKKVSAQSISDTKDNSDTIEQETTDNAKKKFKAELISQKKELQLKKSTLSEQKEQLKSEYDALIDSGDTAGAESLLSNIKELDTQIIELKSQVKKIINERYMVVKSLYTEQELSQYNSASELISKMYADAQTLKEGSIIVKNNIIKFDAPPYIKGGVTLVPVRAITLQLDAQVDWNPETQTVTVTKDDTVVEMTVNSTTVLVNGNPVELETNTEITCARTYVPLRFLSETFSLKVNWDGENEEIDIDEDSQNSNTTDDNNTSTETDTSTDTNTNDTSNDTQAETSNTTDSQTDLTE